MIITTILTSIVTILAIIEQVNTSQVPHVDSIFLLILRVTLIPRKSDNLCYPEMHLMLYFTKEVF